MAPIGMIRGVTSYSIHQNSPTSLILLSTVDATVLTRYDTMQ